VELFEVSSMPDKPFDRGLFLEAVGRASFSIIYDFSKRAALLAFDSNGMDVSKRLSSSIAGLDFVERKCDFPATMPLEFLTLYRSPENTPLSFLSDIFDLGITEGLLCIAFVPVEGEELDRGRSFIEKRLNSMRVGSGYSISDGSIGKRVSRSAQHKDFSHSDEAALLNEMLESLNRSAITYGIAYKVAFAASNNLIVECIISKAALLERHSANCKVEGLLQHVRDMRGMPFGSDTAKSLVNFYGSIKTSYTIPSTYERAGGPIVLGTFLKDSVHDTGLEVGIESPVMNLGFIISGLPGSGKTREAMSILDSISKRKDGTRIVVVSPTDEWDAFALSHGMYLLKICDDRVPMNFFRCPEGSETSRFYESLAMILASASSAGPYRNPMEKCMLNAFRRIYAKTKTPDPVFAYSEIEESIVRMHGKRTNTGIKYSKHGENIKSALENLVSILQMPEYSEVRGVCIEELLDRGVVFDISNAGVETKAYFYALILNQIYSVASSFDSNGDSELRLVICLEEAQMMLKDPRSPAVEDIKYRMQDFRKKGIGLMLLVHNVPDIEVGIRRLCQLKIYLKQAADVADTAAEDLVFAHVENEEVSSKLKHLDARIGALSRVSKLGGSGASHDTIFIKTKEYLGIPRLLENPLIHYARVRRLVAPRKIPCLLTITSKGLEIAGARIKYLGEEVCEYSFDKSPALVQLELIEGRNYIVELLGERGRVAKKSVIIAKPEVHVEG